MLVLQAISLLLLIKVSSPSADEDVQIACIGQRVELTFWKCLHGDDHFTLRRGVDTIVCTESGCRDRTYTREYNSSGCLTVVIANPTSDHDSTHHLEYSRKLSALVVRLHVLNCPSASAHGQKRHQEWETPFDFERVPDIQVSAGVVSTRYHSEYYGLMVTMVTIAVGVMMGLV